MLAVLGFGTLVTFMVTVMRKWATAFVAIHARVTPRGDQIPPGFQTQSFNVSMSMTKR